MKIREVITTFVLYPAYVTVMLLACGTASATTYTVYGLTVKIYAVSSSAGATANMIQSNTGIYNGGPHPWCGNRAYIDTADKELYAAALAAGMMQLPVSLIYDDAAAARYIPGHNGNFTCKVISIFQQ